MRFVKDGPFIPDDLLIARDEGRVIFFCGAGVSRSRAFLPDFFELAQQVIDTLGAAPDSPSRQLMEMAQSITPIKGSGGIVAADRVFGLLEREFRVEEIYSAVARALMPQGSSDLSAHQFMLELAKGPDGKRRIVTTNFDLLFEACDASLPRWKPPRLPDPQRYDELIGIIHLHGHVDDLYTGAVGDGLVLSSAEFGRAYLADGWATAFIRTILERYCVVFVGYTADDPPVQYLLEALNRTAPSRHGVYAFQAGSANDAQAMWLHKGVHSIAYDSAANHKSLWDTLEAWANRAKNPASWYARTIDLARKGPEALLPHERGQVAHVVSHREGAREFATSDPPPPAEWLCVFDSAVRYAKPGHLGRFSEQGPYFDPFDAYGLDSDPVPSKIGPDDHWAKREIPDGVWDCFAPNRLDRQNLRDGDFSAFRGHWAHNVPRLPVRLAQLGDWLGRVCAQPGAAWWAAGQSALHPEIQNQIRHALARAKNSGSPEIRKAWRYILEGWETQQSRLPQDAYELRAAISIDGWDSATIREFCRIHSPFLKITQPHWGGPRPPQPVNNIRLGDMLSWDVEYPRPTVNIPIPNEHLTAVVRNMRTNLELAVALEGELGGYGLENVRPLEPDPQITDEASTPSYGISRLVFSYVTLFRHLTDANAAAARNEFRAWRTDEATIFARLRIWASGDARVVSDLEAGEVLRKLPQSVFWNVRHQRDLLLVLARRWAFFSTDARRRLETRLLRGRSRWNREEKSDYHEHRARRSLDRLYWLKDHGCNFNFDFDRVTTRLRSLAPTWKPEYANNAAASTEARSGWVRTETDYAPLLAEPLSTLLSKAAELSGHEHVQFVERDPFAGLATQRPVRALAALTNAAKRDSFPEWAWRTFLFSDARTSDRPKFSALVGERISLLPTAAFCEFIYPAATWMQVASERLLTGYPETFTRVWDKLMTVLNSRGDAGGSAVLRQDKEAEWATEALNAPVGKLAEALMNDPVSKVATIDTGFPDYWLKRIEQLLALEGDLHRHALVMFSFNLPWFFAIDAAWAERNLFAALKGTEHDQDAFWAGFLWAAKVPNEQLYARLKPSLLDLARRKSWTRRSYGNVLASILLAGWGNANPASNTHCVSDDELRNVLIQADDEFRSNVLWHLERWSSESDSWKQRKLKFLRHVWPRQKTVMTPSTSTRLCELAFDDADAFPSVVDAILPLVTTIEGAHLVLPSLGHATGDETHENIIERFPESTLALLWAVLPEDVSIWPYGASEALQRIAQANSALQNDSRLVELQRRWNAR